MTTPARTPAELTRAIRARAAELGFDACGVARAEPADPHGHLRAWLERGVPESLSYMEKTAAQRADPRVVLPGARSVVALAISYYRADHDPKPWPEGQLKVSRYAVVDDYHIVVRRKVRKLRRTVLQLASDAVVHPTVDTSPVMERAWAERAGIAWVGKSTMAISPRLGTYTFLASLVTTLELTYDEAHADRCGSCTACLDACPTQAFVGPYQLDAKRCITTWNVEERGAFDATTPSLHGWVAGCDVCQEVCPWNKFAKPTRERRFTPRPALAAPDPEVFAARGGPEAVERLGALLVGTALRRTGAAAIARNTRAILGSADTSDLRLGEAPPDDDDDDDERP